jgi:hypothetical protein
MIRQASTPVWANVRAYTHQPSPSTEKNSGCSTSGTYSPTNWRRSASTDPASRGSLVSRHMWRGARRSPLTDFRSIYEMQCHHCCWSNAAYFGRGVYSQRCAQYGSKRTDADAIGNEDCGRLFHVNERSISPASTRAPRSIVQTLFERTRQRTQPCCQREKWLISGTRW